MGAGGVLPAKELPWFREGMGILVSTRGFLVGRRNLWRIAGYADVKAPGRLPGDRYARVRRDRAEFLPQRQEHHGRNRRSQSNRTTDEFCDPRPPYRLRTQRPAQLVLADARHRFAFAVDDKASLQNSSWPNLGRHQGGRDRRREHG